MVFTEVHDIDWFPASDLVIVRNDANTVFEFTLKLGLDLLVGARGQVEKDDVC